MENGTDVSTESVTYYLNQHVLILEWSYVQLANQRL